MGETWTLPHVKRELEEGAEEITVRIEESGDESRLPTTWLRENVRSL